MADKTSKDKVPSKDKKSKPVANCDQFKEVVTNSTQSEATKLSSDLKSINIDSLIRTIRSQKVMVDFDLAMLYGVKNKRLNEQVKRNIERFPDDFMFQLTKDEAESLSRC